LIGVTVAFVCILFLVFFEIIYNLGYKLVKKGTALENEIVERQKAQEETKASLMEKELLLREIHHRVKNNMQIVSSLIRLQLHSIVNEKGKEILKETQNRIQAMSLIHETLYRPGNVSEILLRNYIKELAMNLFDSFGVDPERVQLQTDMEDIAIDIDTATPCGLIINELITNSLKYAFPEERAGVVSITLSKDWVTKELKLIIKDNGIGLPPDFDIKKAKSLGLILAVNLAEQQLKGKCVVNRENGTEFVIIFKEPAYEKSI
jgi:two-component sensor histidine kinase